MWTRSWKKQKKVDYKINNKGEEKLCALSKTDSVEIESWA